VVIIPMLIGAGMGIGVWICRRAFLPRPTPIAMVLARLDRPGRPLDAGPDITPAMTDRVGRLARQILQATGINITGGPAFELAERTPERHALDKVGGALLGLLAPNLLGIVLSAAGMHLPMGIIGALSIAAAIGAFFLPELTLRDEAERRRRAFRHSLSAYLDLVNILLAGGAGIETSLYAAAHAGEGWGFEQLRRTLDRARYIGASPWDCFAELGANLGVSELTELAASVSLAGSQGARIRASLAAKADALRGHQVAETESSAEAATERMTIPIAVMLSGFLIFIAYPALLTVTNVQTTGP
jgi:Flp pilus assembly protein TadB